MTRKNYLLASAAAAGAYWAWRRWGADRGWGGSFRARLTGDTSSTARGETIFSNTPSATTSDLSDLGATEGL